MQARRFGDGDGRTTSVPALGMTALTPRIFVAEDDEDLRALLVTMLENDGYLVHAAADGSELLTLLAHAALPDRPDLIVTDVLMPGYSGIGVLAAVRGAGWRTPTILITAHRGEQLTEEAADLGATALIHKPLDLADLRVAILRALHGNRGSWTAD